MKSIYTALLLSFLSFACASDLKTNLGEENPETESLDREIENNKDPNATSTSENDPNTTSTSEADPTIPIEDLSNYFILETESFEVPAGEERFLCYAFTLEEDLVIDQWVYESRSAIHHLIVAETLGDEPDGFSDCDVLFRATWFPYFVAGSTDTVIDAPEGSGYILEKGKRMLVQLHLLNADVEDAKEELKIKMRKSEKEDLDPIGMMVFGTMNLSLPANDSSTVTDTCEMSKEVEVFTVFPHMHYLGTSIVVEHGSSEEELTEIYRRDPWDFDDQRLEPFELSLAKGDFLKVSCTYDNTTEKVVTFGESTLNEMCFLITYITGTEGGIDSCMSSGVEGFNIFPEECGTGEPNELGVGATCTKDGGECSENLYCSQDFLGSSVPGLCMGLNICETSADCGGGGAICCAPAQYDTINLCLPQGCAIPGCDPK